MKRFFLPLIAALALPTFVNAGPFENLTSYTKNDMNMAVFSGQLQALCRAEDEGFISNKNVLEVAAYSFLRHQKEFLGSKKEAYEEASIVIDLLEEDFPNCFKTSKEALKELKALLLKGGFEI